MLRYQQRWSRTTAVEGCVHAIISIILLDIPRTEWLIVSIRAEYVQYAGGYVSDYAAAYQISNFMDTLWVAAG